MKQPFKKIFLLFALASLPFSILPTATLADLQADVDPSNPNPDPLKTLNDAISLQDYYKNKPQTFDVYMDQLDEFFYHQFDTTFTDLIQYMAKYPNTTAQDAIDWAKGQQATKGGDPAELKACNDKLTTCTATVTNYATQRATLHQAASTFGKSISDSDKLYRDDNGAIKAIPEYVRAFIKYAEITNVSFSDKNESTIWLGKKWLDHYFDNGCIIESLTNFYIDTLSILISNDNLKSWNFVADLSPSIKTIDANKTSLMTKLTQLNLTGGTCPVCDYSSIKNAFIRDHTYELTFVSEVKKNEITNRNNPNYLKDNGDYPAYINNMINLIVSVTDKLFANDSNYKNKQQTWFDKHIIATIQTTRDTGIPNLKDTIDTQLDAVLAAQNNTQASSKIDPAALTALNDLEASIKSLYDNLNPATNSDIYADTSTGSNVTKAKGIYNDMAGLVDDVTSKLKAVYDQLDSKDKPSDLADINTLPRV